MVGDHELLEALRVIVVDESVGDFAYSIRERTHGDVDYEGSSWDHPRVQAFCNAVDVLAQYIREHDASASAGTATEGEG